MKIRKVSFNNRKKAFEVVVGKNGYTFPYIKAEPVPGAGNAVIDAFVDDELGREGFTYVLRDGCEGSVHVDHVLEYNRDPALMRDLFMYLLTLEVKKQVADGALSDRELSRRLHTSPAQFYRLLNERNTAKSPFQMFELLRTLGCDVNVVVKRGRKKDVIEWNPAAGK